jgi:hypothetical protein
MFYPELFLSGSRKKLKLKTKLSAGSLKREFSIDTSLNSP